MQKLKCYQISELTVQEVLNEFKKRPKEFGFSEQGIFSVSVMPPALGTTLAAPSGFIGQTNSPHLTTACTTEVVVCDAGR
jgi:hypothetical protein